MRLGRVQRPAVEWFEHRTLLSGNTYTVDSLGDSGSGSGLDGDLRYAITQADSNAGSTIDFSVTGTIQLSKALPQIVASMTIDGPGASSLTVKGGGSSSNFSILYINGQQTVDISGLTIAGGNLTTVGGGAGIDNQFGLLTLTDCTITGNNASGSEDTGGGILNYGTLNVEDCTISGNYARVAGGGIYDSASGYGPVTVIGSTISGILPVAAVGGSRCRPGTR